MFTAFMVAITMTTVANVLVTMALAPLLTALIARARARPAAAGAHLGGDRRRRRRHRLDVRARARASSSRAICSASSSRSACRSPRRSTGPRSRRAASGSVDLLVAVLIGATLSALLTLPLALPLRASAHDIALLALLGVAQLAVPCLVAVAAARVLVAPEVALLSLLEIVFGVTWTWLAGEAPSGDVLVGGALVLGALVANESIALRRRNSFANAT